MLANWSASMGVASDKPYLTDHNFPLPEPRVRAAFRSGSAVPATLMSAQCHHGS